MDSLSYDDLLNSLKLVDTRDGFTTIESDAKPKVEGIVVELCSKIKYHTKTILGLDIYEYSKYEERKQSLIPFVFELLFNSAKEQALVDRLLFPEDSVDPFSSYKFIQTGDGGYQVFENPLQALAFNSLFHVQLKKYNSNNMYSKLRSFVGQIELRSCISTDNLFRYESNYYGPAIINNARILSKDKLTRFLIDDKTNNWFLKKMNGIENITEISVEKVMSIFPHLKVPESGFSTVFFDKEKEIRDKNLEPKITKFKTCHIQKIGRIKAKDDTISIYNVEIQLYSPFGWGNDDKIGGFITTLGNSNSTGIND